MTNKYIELYNNIGDRGNKEYLDWRQIEGGKQLPHQSLTKERLLLMVNVSF